MVSLNVVNAILGMEFLRNASWSLACSVQPVVTARTEGIQNDAPFIVSFMCLNV